MNAAQRPLTSASTSLHSVDYANGYRESAVTDQANIQPDAYVSDSQLSGTQAFDQESSNPKQVSREQAAAPKRKLHSGVRRAIAFESSVKLTVNLLLSIVATTTIAKLIPYYQSQQQRLSTLQESVVVAEEKNAELRAQFGRNFDPAQAQHIMQEQSGMAYPNQKKVIWTAPLDESQSE